jgi:hypothetical protein
MNCNACTKALEPNSFLHSRLCKQDFHYKCLSIKSSQFSVLSEEFLLSWVCPACTSITKRNASKPNCNTPVRQGHFVELDDTMNMSYDLETTTRSEGNISLRQHLPTTSQSTDQAVTMEKLSQLMDQKLNAALTYHTSSLRASLKSDIESLVRGEINDALRVVKDEFTATTDFIVAEQEDLKTKINNQITIIENLQKDKNDLKLQTSKVVSKLSIMESLSRSHNLEIHAVPENKNEDLPNLFHKLCQVVGASIDQSAVRACRRVAKMNPASNRPRNILVTLSSPQQRDLVISSVYRFNKSRPNDMLSCLHLGMNGADRRIYVAEHLSPELKALHAESRKFAADNNFKFVWIRFGKIYIRKDESSNAINVRNSDVLLKLKNSK